MSERPLGRELAFLLMDEISQTRITLGLQLIAAGVSTYVNIVIRVIPG